MAEARYWRVTRIEPYQYETGLVLSELALYDNDTRVDGSAMLSCPVAPTSGSLLDLGDSNFATTVSWPIQSLLLPGFSFVFDFGTPQVVNKIGVSGPSRDTFAHKLSLEYSSDGIAWTELIKTSPSTRWVSATTIHTLAEELPGDLFLDSVELLLNMNGANDSTVFADSSPRARVVTPTGNVKISTAQFRYGGASALFDGFGDYLSVAHALGLVMDSANFTVECWVYLPSAPTNTVTIANKSGQNNVSVPNWFFFISNTRTLGFYAGQSGSPGTIFMTLLSTATVPLGQWCHVAATKDGSVYRIFIDGVQVGTVTNATVPSDARAGAVVIGWQLDQTGTEFNGFMDDFRITKGVARYTGNFTPPTTELPATSGIDPSIGNIKLLLNLNGPNGSTTFTDSSPSPKTPAVVGDGTTISTVQSKFGGGSLLLNSGTTALYYSGNDFWFEDKDFTIEGWVFQVNTAFTRSIFRRLIDATATGLSYELSVVNGSYYNFRMGIGGTVYQIFTADGSAPQNQWAHLAVTRSGGTVRLFINGVLAGSTTVPPTGVMNNPDSALFAIGAGSAMGYIDDVRVTKGTAQYTANFSVPTSEFAITQAGDSFLSNVSLLLHGDEAPIIDTSNSLRAVSALGAVAISTAQSRFGGASIDFNGTDAALSVAASSDFAFGTADFTIELFCWIRSQPSGSALISEQYTGTGDTVQFALGFCTATEIASLTGNLPFFGWFNGTTWTGIRATSALDLSTWHHIAVVRHNSTVTLYINGVAAASASMTVNVTFDDLIYVGRRWDTPGGGSTPFFNGYIDELRITRNVARYTANFNPPTAAFFDIRSRSDSTPIRRSALPAIEEITFFPLAGSSVVSEQRAKAGGVDVEDGGYFQIVGTVKEVALPNNTPLSRRVVLYEESYRRLIRSVFSDEAGNYKFDYIRGDRTYTVIAYDHTGVYRAVVADKLTPTPMP